MVKCIFILSLNKLLGVFKNFRLYFKKSSSQYSLKVHRHFLALSEPNGFLHAMKHCHYVFITTFCLVHDQFLCYITVAYVFFVGIETLCFVFSVVRSKSTYTIFVSNPFQIEFWLLITQNLIPFSIAVDVFIKSSKIKCFYKE